MKKILTEVNCYINHVVESEEKLQTENPTRKRGAKSLNKCRFGGNI